MLQSLKVLRLWYIYFSEGSNYNAAPTDAYDPYYDNFEDPINYYDDNPYPDYDPHYDYDTFDYPEDIYSNAPDVYGAGVTEEYLGDFFTSNQNFRQ